jgi:hypothetical protein
MMLMKVKVWILLTASVLAIFVYFIISRSNSIREDNGRGNNANRIKTHVPIIENNMSEVIAFDSFIANHWEADEDSQSNDSIVHYSKNVTPIEPLNRVEEKDLFKKRIDESRYYELYIKSVILNNSHSEREGILTISSPEGNKTIILDEIGIDSVARNWRLDYLVSNK